MTTTTVVMLLLMGCGGGFLAGLLGVGGGMVQDGVYSCDIEVVNKQNAAQLRVEHIILVKQKNRWVLR